MSASCGSGIKCCKVKAYFKMPSALAWSAASRWVLTVSIETNSLSAISRLLIRRVGLVRIMNAVIFVLGDG